MATALVGDFALASSLLLIGFALRARVRMLQQLYIPTAVVAGFVGLLLGPELLGRWLPVSIQFSDEAASLSFPLLAVVFSTQFIGASCIGRTAGPAATVFFLNCGTACLQVFGGLCLMGLCIHFQADAPLGMGLMPFTGFYGGHGVPAAVAQQFAADGYWSADTAASVGNAFATVGLLFGVIFGLTTINIAARRGLLSPNAGNQQLARTAQGQSPSPSEPPAAVRSVVQRENINPVAFHLAIIGSILWLGYIVLDWLTQFPWLSSLPITVPVIVLGLLLSFLEQRTCLKRYLDRDSLLSVSGAALEYLIVVSTASMKLHIFTDFGFELILLSVVLLFLTSFYVFFFGRLWHKKHWMEHALGTFGLSTGVLATGFLLIRAADPDGHTAAATNLALGNSVSTITVQMFLLVAFPAMVVHIPAAAILLSGAGFFLFTLAGCVLFASQR